MAKNPSWYKESKLKKVEYAPNYFGYIIDLGDGTCRYANDPMLGESNTFLPNFKEINRTRPHWGDRVKLVNGKPDRNQIIERWEPEKYDEDGDRIGEPKPQPRKQTKEWDICYFGQQVFHPYEAKLYGLDVVRKKIEENQHKFSSNDWGVLSCYCEGDKVATLMLHELENRADAKKNVERGDEVLSMSSMFFLSRLENQEQLDRHFKTKEFTQQAVVVWRETMGPKKWALFVEGMQENVKALPFLGRVFDKHIKPTL